jgi:hypothetical protein
MAIPKTITKNGKRLSLLTQGRSESEARGWVNYAKKQGYAASVKHVSSGPKGYAVYSSFTGLKGKLRRQAYPHL